jgi:hypothetical protein
VWSNIFVALNYVAAFIIPRGTTIANVAGQKVLQQDRGKKNRARGPIFVT